MSEQTNTTLEITSLPIAVKNPSKDSMVRSLPTQRRRVTPRIDLVDQGEVFVPFGILNFIDADSVDLAGRSVFQTPGDDMFDRVEDLVPGSAKGLRRLFP
jgi:hypothetical protein